MNRTRLLGILVIIFFGLVTRFYALDTVPNNIQPDAVDTLRIYLERQHNHDFTFLSTNWNGSHVINQWLIALPWELTGRQFWGTRLGPALLSMVCLVLFFLIIDKISRHQLVISVTMTLLLASNPWFLNFSRSGWENIANSVLVCLLVYAVLLPKTRWRLSWQLLLLTTVAGPYLYHPGKSIAAISALALLIVIVKAKSTLRQKVLKLLVSAAVVVLSLSPFLLMNTPVQLGRIATVSIWANQNPAAELQQNITRNVLGFTKFHSEQWHIGVNSRYLPLGGQVLNPVLIITYLVGVVLSLKRYKRLLIIAILLIFPINLLSLNTPDAARSVHVVPFFYLFMSLPVITVWNGIKKLATRWPVLSKLYLPTVIGTLWIGLVLVIGMQDLLRYWVWIQNPRILAVREPAVYRFEYQQWLDDVQFQLRTLGRTINIYEWRDQHKVNYEELIP